MNTILTDSNNRAFKPFDRVAQFNESKGKTLQQLLEEFRELRKQNILILQSKKLNDDDLKKTGIHPEIGTVTLNQLLSTWAVHHQSHTAQITRVMAKQYKSEVGPWVAYLRILNS